MKYKASKEDLERMREWRKNNKERQNKYFLKLHHEGKTWAKRNPDKVKAKRRRRTLKKYGLTIEEWNEMFASQGNSCAICLSKETARFGWATDHDHITGEVRGILCGNCNTAIGQMKDDPTRLRLAADYLENAYQNKLRAYKASK